MIHALDLSTPTGRDALAYIAATSGQDLAACYQCGKCAAGCPLAAAMDLAPQQVIRALQLGQPDMALAARTPWLCVGCQTCVTRCPCEVDLPRVMDALRSWALATGRAPAERDVGRFHQAFLKSVQLTGRVYEVGLLGGYNLVSGHLLAGMDLAWPMIRRGKIRPLPRRVKAGAELAGIFHRAEEVRARQVRAAGQPGEGASA